MAQWLHAWSRNPEGVGSSPGVDTHKRHWFLGGVYIVKVYSTFQELNASRQPVLSQRGDLWLFPPSGEAFILQWIEYKLPLPFYHYLVPSTLSFV